MTLKKIAYIFTTVASVVTMGIGFSTMDTLNLGRTPLSFCCHHTLYGHGLCHFKK